MLHPSVLRMHMAWAKWCRSITLPSLLYKHASTLLLEIWGRLHVGTKYFLEDSIIYLQIFTKIF